MKILALVIDDEVKKYKDKKTGEDKTTRTLHVVDKDPEKRLKTMVKLSIPLDDRVAGPHDQSNIRDCVITASIDRIQQFEWDSSLGFSGEVLRIEGKDVFEPAKTTSK